MGEINVVPYIDVMLVLLIIFMITAPLLKEGVKVDLPTAGAKPIDPAFLAETRAADRDHRRARAAVRQFRPESGQTRLRSHRERAYGGAPAPRSADPRAGQGRYHGALRQRWRMPWCCCSVRAPTRSGF